MKNGIDKVLMRVIELCVEDKELHDSLVRLFNAQAYYKEVMAKRAEAKLKKG
jgi:hypothetical protein